MKKIGFLRKKYPRFIYKNFFHKISKNDLEISFYFKIEPDIEFRPKIIIKNIDKNQIKIVGDRILNNLVFNLGLIDLLSYWKATCSPELEIQAGPLNQEQIKWWHDLIIKGMGQFFYENKINWRPSNFLKIILVKKDNSIKAPFLGLREQILVPIGGGKDSIVTLEILKNASKKTRCFSLNPTEAAKKIIKIGRCQSSIIIERQIDPKLLMLNRKGFLNGHTPFSAYLAFLSVLVAVIFGQKYIAFSNERSSNEGNIKYLGKMINHQYSKSFDFERRFREYAKKYLVKDVEYFSFLRPLYEIQIAKLFSQNPKYFNAFLSCNEAYKTYSGTKKPTKKWCGQCPKCLFIFTCLYPFVKKQKLIKIFGENLFENRKLLPIMQQLIGEKGFKPFECVGTKKESLVAFYLSWKKNKVGKRPFLLKYFERNVLPKYPNLEEDSKKLMNSWSNQHNLPKDFNKTLKNAISLDKIIKRCII